MNDELRRMESVYAVYVRHHRTLRISVASNIQSEVSKKSISKNRAKGIWECHKCKTLPVVNAHVSVRCKMIQSLHTARLNERRLISKIRLVHSAVCLSRLHPSKLIVKCYSWCSTRWCSKGRFRRHGEDDRSMQRGLDRLGPWCFP